MYRMDSELQTLADWIKRNRKTARRIQPSELPSDIDTIDWDGRESELRTLLKNVLMPSRRSYWLGTVVTGVFGMQGSASHRVVRGRGGQTWTMYVSGPDFPDGEEFIGNFISDQIIREVEELGYQVTRLQWISMGWRPGVP